MREWEQDEQDEEDEFYIEFTPDGDLLADLNKDSDDWCGRYGLDELLADGGCPGFDLDELNDSEAEDDNL